jgi:hypothetical protein
MGPVRLSRDTQHKKIARFVNENLQDFCSLNHESTRMNTISIVRGAHAPSRVGFGALVETDFRAILATDYTDFHGSIKTPISDVHANLFIFGCSRFWVIRVNSCSFVVTIS